MIDFFHRLGSKLFLFAFLSHVCVVATFAQSAPEFVYEVNHVANGVPGTATPLTSRSDPDSGGNGNLSYSETSSASASGGALTLSTSYTVSRVSGSGVYQLSGGYQFSLWARHPGDIYLSGAGSASYSISGPNGSSVSYGGYMYNAGTFSASQGSGGIVESGPSSRSGDSEVHLTCSSSTTKTFTAYPGVTYYKVAPSGVYGVTASPRLEGSGAGTVTISGSQTATAEYADIDPTTVVDDGKCSAGASFTFTHTSRDEDSPVPQSTGAICSAAWAVTGPSSYSSTSPTVTSPVQGQYNASVTVTDNEGATASNSKSIYCRKATGLNPGTTPTTSLIQSHQCEASPGTGQSAEPAYMSYASSWMSQRTMQASGSVTPDSGNAFVHISSSSQVTRGGGLNLDIYVNSQQTKGSLGYSNMRNAYYTYSIGLFNAGGLTHLIDADGSAYHVGTWDGVSTKPAGFMGTFQALPAGEMKLYNAGPPGEIWQAGNWTYFFDGWYRLKKIVDPAGNIQEVTWSNSGSWRWPVEVTDLSTGRKLTFTYSPSASNNPFEVQKITESSTGDYTEFVYNSNDKLSIVYRRDSSNNVLEKVEITYYNDTNSDRLKDVTKDDEAASRITFTYDAQAAVSGKIAYLANMTWAGGGTNNNYFVAPGSGGDTSVETTNSLGGKTKYDFDSSGRLIRTTLPTMNGASAGAVYTFQYDSNHNVTQVSDGATITDFTYNSVGKVTEVDDNNGGVWTFTYESNGIDLAEIEDSLGTLVELDYGNTSLPHHPTSITDGDGNVWTKTYNAYGQNLTIVPPSGSPTGTTTYEYEETSSSPNFGFLKKITNGAGNETRFNSYTGSGFPTEIEQTPESGTDIAYQFTYDAAGRTKRVTHPDGKYREYAYTYRKLATSRDEAGAVTSFDFCAVCGKLTGVDMPLSKSLAWDQDADHRTTAFIDARSKETEYEYGLAGELKKTLYPDGSYVLYRYDNYGRLAETEDTRGHKKQYTYDASGRVQEIDLVPASGTPTAISYTFRTDGRASAVTDEVGTTTYSYTAGRKVSAVEYDWSASGLTNAQTLEYSFNPDGTLLKLEWKDGTTSVASWDYDYDGAGRLTEIVNSFGETTTFTYDGVGKLKTQTNENGTSTTYTYNQDRGWPTQIVHKLGSSPFASYSLEYDGGSDTVGNITKVTELDSSEVEYSYDAIYRLSAEDRTGTGAYTRSYGYDLAGNMTTYGGSTFASYDDANKISSLTGGSASYDADGNMTAVSGGGIPATTLTWDVRNKLSRQQTSSDDLTYGYDFTGKRVLRFPTGTSTKSFFVFFEDTLIGEVTSGSPSYVYSWGSAGLISHRAIGSNESLWYHFGPHAETRYTTDALPQVASEYRYDGFGRSIYSSGTQAGSFQFGGREGYYRDGEAGLMLATNRWYLPQLARWVTRDPIGYNGGSNLYEYVKNNPTNWIDPSGLHRKPGKTPPSQWPPLPPNLGGKKPKWRSEGYWECPRGRNITWDDRAHGAGVDRGEGALGGHWDDENSNDRWNEQGELLPGSPSLEMEDSSGYSFPVPKAPSWQQLLPLLPILLWPLAS